MKIMKKMITIWRNCDKIEKNKLSAKDICQNSGELWKKIKY